MNETKREELRLLSRCLGFPDSEAMKALAVLDCRLKANGCDEKVEASLASLWRCSLSQLQEAYSEAFDLRPETCLYLAYHKYGEGYQRQEAMSQLNRLYSGLAGQAPSGELPDFLPLMLEFLSIAPESVSRCLVDEYGEDIAALGRRLTDAGSPYGCLFDPLGRFLDELR